MSKKDEIIAVIKRLAEKLGRAPSQAEFRRECEISWHQVYKHFRGMRAAVRAAGLEPGPRGGPLNERALVLDWARVVRELGRLPYRREYDERGKHHSVTLHARIGWHEMGHRFVLLVREFGIEREWADVVEIVVRKYPLLQDSPRRRGGAEKNFEPQRTQRNTEETLVFSREYSPPRAAVPHGHGNPMRLGRMVAAAMAVEILRAAEKHLEPQRTLRNTEADSGETGAGVLAEAEIEAEALAEKPGAAGIGEARRGRVLYGEPLGLAAMAHAPTCEDGVLFLFGVLAEQLGFRIERIQKAFPDCEAKREVAPGRWELQLWELELYSRNFKEHRHDATKCHGIVCWKHNWPDVPEWLEVIELSRVVKS